VQICDLDLCQRGISNVVPCQRFGFDDLAESADWDGLIELAGELVQLPTYSGGCTHCNQSLMGNPCCVSLRFTSVLVGYALSHAAALRYSFLKRTYARHVVQLARRSAAAVLAT
jgi:hypothetical protein